MHFAQTTSVQICFFRKSAEIYGQSCPVAGTVFAAGVDLRACFFTEESMVILPGERSLIPSGIGIAPMQPGIAGFVYSRSGLGAKVGLVVAQGVGVIDADYRGEIMIYLLNTSLEPQTVHRGDRIAQLVMQPYFQAEFTQVEALSETSRGAGGFGHTGSV